MNELILLFNVVDFQKDFDKVPHQRLFIKLRAHAMGDSIGNNWVSSWLTDRKQRVTVEGGKSSWTTVPSEAPHGSVLGRIRFIIYNNDLDESVGSNILKIADDTNIFRKVRSGQGSPVLQDDLDSMVSWSEQWQTLFNQDNCKCLRIGRTNSKSYYKIQNAVLNTTAKKKDIGVTIQYIGRSESF